MGTTETVKVFIEDKDVAWEETAPGIKRKIMSYDERLMVVKVFLKKVQWGFCISIIIRKSVMWKAECLKWKLAGKRRY